MDEKKRFRAFVAILAAVILGGIVFVVTSVAVEDDMWFTVASTAILAAIALVAIAVARKRQKELKSGFPQEDERSRAIATRAGYLAFWVSMYSCLALGWVLGIFVDDSSEEFLSVGELMFVLVAAMGIIYIVIWAALSRGKDMP